MMTSCVAAYASGSAANALSARQRVPGRAVDSAPLVWPPVEVDAAICNLAAFAAQPDQSSGTRVLQIGAREEG